MKTCDDYERILREADMIKNLKCPGIPVVFDIEDNNDSICIIEEYISGKSLTEYISEAGCITAHDMADIGIRICDIISYLHECAGIVHLDIKPSNIIIRDNSDGKREVFIIDFDNSDMIDGRHAGHAMYITAGYAAPEQYNGDGSVRSDIYYWNFTFVYGIKWSCTVFYIRSRIGLPVVFKFNWTCYKKVYQAQFDSKI